MADKDNAADKVAAQMSTLGLSSSFNVHAQEFVPTFQSNQPIQPAASSSVNVDAYGTPIYDYPVTRHDDDFMVLQEIQVGMEQIANEPENFEAWAEAIGRRISSTDEHGVHLAANLIIDTALSVSHFSYNAARLCGYARVSAAMNGTKLRDALLKRLRWEHENRRTTAILCPERYRNLAMFFGEFYLLPVTQAGNRLTLLAQTVLQEVETLLDTTVVPDPGNLEENFKCAIKILKCCGGCLEKDSSGCTGPVIDKMDNFCQSVTTLNQSAKLQFESLKRLRLSNWGESSSYNGTANANNDIGATSDGLYIGPDGQPLSQEELDFLQENLGRHDSSKSSGDDDPLAFNDDYLNGVHE